LSDVPDAHEEQVRRGELLLSTDRIQASGPGPVGFRRQSLLAISISYWHQSGTARMIYLR
jgi:hypothetical protein